MPKILVTCAQMQGELPRYLERLRAQGFDVVAPPIPGQMFSSRQMVDMMGDVVGVIAGDDQLDADFFAGSPSLRVLIRWGIGMDAVDHDAAREHGVVVRNTPGVFGGEVADSAMAYVLLLSRGHHLVDRDVRRGDWPKREGVSLEGSVIGIVGQGHIGRALAARALGFGMRVVAYDPYVTRSQVGNSTALVDSLVELLAQSRFVVLTCPFTDETRHLIGADAVAAMRSDAFLINVARGPVVDEAALIQGLRRGAIAGAGLDVFEVEPLPPHSPLRAMENVVLGAHNGSNTREGVARASLQAVDTLLEELASL